MMGSSLDIHTPKKENSSLAMSLTSKSTSSDYAFVNHDQHTLNNNLPPAVDNKSLARQKRRRTSPEDTEILEAEYAKNHRPSSATRMKIAAAVSLDKKAIDTWFQNRRKKDRGQESSAEESCLSSDPVEPTQPSSVEVEQQVSTSTVTDDASSDEINTLKESETVCSSSPTLNTSSSSKVNEELRPDSGPNVKNVVIPSLKRAATWSVSSMAKQDGSFTSFLWTSDVNDAKTTGYLADRLASSQQRLEEVISQPASKSVTSSPIETLTPNVTRTLNRSQSLRISTDENGNASIVDRGVPSPASQPSSATHGNFQDGFDPTILLQRKRADLGPGFKPASLTSSASFGHYRNSNGNNSRPQSSNSQSIPTHCSPVLGSSDTPPSATSSRYMRHGNRQPRSHDSRLWESCADKSGGQELSKLADSESSGSAKDAIEAMRNSISNSSMNRFGRRPLGSVSGNGEGLRTGSLGVMKRPNVLRRAGTFAGRTNMSTNVMSMTASDAHMKKPGIKRSSSVVFEIHEDPESDKENRDPDRPWMPRSQTIRVEAVNERQVAPTNHNGKRERSQLMDERGHKRRQSTESEKADSGDETMLIVAGLLQLKNGR